MTTPFSQLVQQRTALRGWTLRELAKQAGVGLSTVHRCLNGKGVMLSTALKIAAALGLDTGDLGGRPAAVIVAEQLRCWECALCERTGSLVCNNPEGACHQGDCEPEELP
jgi:transcriptional regulator with XRE-family HTH domain